MPVRDLDDAVQPAPRFAALWAFLLYVAATLALGYPALGGQFLISPISDQFLGGYPVREFAAASLRAGGGIPLWNPYLMGGLPYVAAMHGDIYYPTFLLRAIMPTDVAMTWSFMLHYPLAGLFAFLFLRAWGLSFFPSLLGGLAYLMCGPIASYVAPGHDGKLYVSTLLPLMLWALTRGVRDGRRWAWGVAVIATGLAVLSPHPQLLQYFLLVAGAFALWVAFGTHEAGRLDRGTAVRRLGLSLGAVLLGMLMGAVQYLPVMEYVKWSPRAAGGAQTGWEHAVSYSFPIEEIVNMYVPEFTGILERYWGRNGIHFHSEYMGAGLLVLAFAGLGAHTLRGRRGFAWFWVGTAIVSLLWALGGNTPFYHLVYALVPGTKFFRAPSTMIYVTAFSVCVLAALGTERLLARQVSQRYLLGWAIAGLVVALLGLTGALSNVADAVGESAARSMAATRGQPEAWQQYFDQIVAPGIQENRGALSFGALRSFLFVVAIAGLGLAHLRRIVPRHVVGWALVLVVGADFYTVLQQYWRFLPPAETTYGTNAAIEAIKKDGQPGRVLALPIAEQPTRDPMLRGDGLMVHGVRLYCGYHGNELGRFRDATKCDQGREGNPSLWHLYNVRYLLTNSPINTPGIQQIAGPVQSAYAKRTGSDEKLYAYRLPGSNPYAWVVPAVLKAPDDQVLATVSDPRFDSTYQSRVALADTAAPFTQNANPAELPQPVAVAATVKSYAPGRVSLALDQPAPAGSALVVSENYYPGWTATVDGKAAPVGRVDYTLIGVGLPTGARTVELAFTSARSATGKLLTLLALGLAVVVIALGVVTDRRRGVVV